MRLSARKRGFLRESRRQSHGQRNSNSRALRRCGRGSLAPICPGIFASKHPHAPSLRTSAALRAPFQSEFLEGGAGNSGARRESSKRYRERVARFATLVRFVRAGPYQRAQSARAAACSGSCPKQVALYPALTTQTSPRSQFCWTVQRVEERPSGNLPRIVGMCSSPEINALAICMIAVARVRVSAAVLVAIEVERRLTSAGNTTPANL